MACIDIKTLLLDEGTALEIRVAAAIDATDGSSDPKKTFLEFLEDNNLGGFLENETIGKAFTDGFESFYTGSYYILEGTVGKNNIKLDRAAVIGAMSNLGKVYESWIDLKKTSVKEVREEILPEETSDPTQTDVALINPVTEIIVEEADGNIGVYTPDLFLKGINDSFSFMLNFFDDNITDASQLIGKLQAFTLNSAYIDFENGTIPDERDNRGNNLIDQRIKEGRNKLVRDAYYEIVGSEIYYPELDEGFISMSKNAKEDLINKFFQTIVKNPELKSTNANAYSDFLIGVYYDQMNRKIFKNSGGNLIYKSKGQYFKRNSSTMREGYSADDNVTFTQEARPLIKLLVSSLRMDDGNFVPINQFYALVGNINRYGRIARMNPSEEYKEVFKDIAEGNSTKHGFAATDQNVRIAKAIYEKLLSDSEENSLSSISSQNGRVTDIFNTLINELSSIHYGHLSEIIMKEGKPMLQSTEKFKKLLAERVEQNRINTIFVIANNFESQGVKIDSTPDYLNITLGNYTVRVFKKTKATNIYTSKGEVVYDGKTLDESRVKDFLNTYTTDSLSQDVYEKLKNNNYDKIFLESTVNTFLMASKILDLHKNQGVSSHSFTHTKYWDTVSNLAMVMKNNKGKDLKDLREEIINNLTLYSPKSDAALNKEIETVMEGITLEDVKSTVTTIEGTQSGVLRLVSPGTDAMSAHKRLNKSPLFQSNPFVKNGRAIMAVTKIGGIKNGFDIYPFKQMDNITMGKLELNTYYSNALFESNETEMFIRPFTQSDKSSQDLFQIDRRAMDIQLSGVSQSSIDELKFLHFESRRMHYKQLEARLISDYVKVLGKEALGKYPGSLQELKMIMAQKKTEGIDLEKQFKEEVGKHSFTQQGIYYVDGIHNISPFLVSEVNIFKTTSELKKIEEDTGMKILPDVLNKNSKIQRKDKYENIIGTYEAPLYVDYMENKLKESAEEAFRKPLKFNKQSLVYFEKNNKFKMRKTRKMEIINNMGGKTVVHPLYEKFFYEWNYIAENLRDIVYGNHIFHNKKTMAANLTDSVKRSLPATFHPYSLGLEAGVPDKSKIVTLVDPKISFSTLLGREISFAKTDGASFSTGLSMLQKQHSLGGISGYYPGVNQKSIGFHKGEDYGEYSLQKHNDFAMTNEMLRNSKGQSGFNLHLLNECLMLNSNFSIVIDEETAARYRTLAYRNGVVEEVGLQAKTYTNALDIWNDLGAERTVIEDPKGHIAYNGKKYSWADLSTEGRQPKHRNGNYAYSQKLMHELTVEFPEMKAGMLETIALEGSIKVGAINPMKVDYNTFDPRMLLSYGEYSNVNKGVQLNPEKEVDSNEGTLSSQLLGAIANAGFTYDDSMKVYKIIQKLTVSRLETDALKNLDKIFSKDVDLETRKAWVKQLSEFTSEKLSKDVATSGTVVSLAETILAKFKGKSNTPFDHSQVYSLLTAAINSYMNAHSIRNKIPGLQLVLVPAVCKLYNHNGTFMMRDDIEASYHRQGGVAGFNNFDEYFESIKATQRDLEKAQYFVLGKNGEEVPLDQMPEAIALAQATAQLKAGVEGVTKETVLEKRNALQARLNELQKEIAYEQDNIYYNKDGVAIYKAIPGEIVLPSIFAKKYGIVPGQTLESVTKETIANHLREKYKIADYEAMIERLQELGINDEGMYKKVWIKSLLLSDMMDDYEARESELTDDELEHLELLRESYDELSYVSSVFDQIKTKDKNSSEGTVRFKDVDYAVKDIPLLMRILNNSISAIDGKIPEMTERFNTMYEAEGIDIEALSSESYDSFIKSLEGLNMRIPLQSLASVMKTKAVGFLWGMNNAVMVNDVHQSLTGGDFDVDKTNYVTYEQDSNGIMYKWSPDMNISDKSTWVDDIDQVLQYFENGEISVNGLKNYMAYLLMKQAAAPGHALVRETDVNTDTVNRAAEKNSAAKENLSKNNPVSNQTMLEKTLSGKAGVGVYAVGIKLLMALQTMTHNSFNSGDKNAMRLATLIPLRFNGKTYSSIANTNVHLLGEDVFYDFLGHIAASEGAPLQTDKQREEFIQEYIKRKNIEESAVDTLGELLNAAVDNAKNLTLGAINGGTQMGAIYNMMTIMGIPFQETIDFITNPLVNIAIALTRKEPFSKEKYVGIKDAVKFLLQNPIAKKNQADKPFFETLAEVMSRKQTAYDTKDSSFEAFLEKEKDKLEKIRKDEPTNEYAIEFHEERVEIAKLINDSIDQKDAWFLKSTDPMVMTMIAEYLQSKVAYAGSIMSKYPNDKYFESFAKARMYVFENYQKYMSYITRINNAIDSKSLPISIENLLEMPDFSSTLEKLYEISEKAAEFKLLGTSLGINGGMKPTEYEIYSFTSSLEKFVNKKLKKIVRWATNPKHPNHAEALDFLKSYGETVDSLATFDFNSFFESATGSDTKYADRFTNIYNGYMRLNDDTAIESTVNILHAIRMNPHYLEQFATVGRAKNWGMSVSIKKSQAEPLLNLFKENNFGIADYLDEANYNKLRSILDEVLVSQYFDQRKPMIMGIDLSTDRGQSEFCKFMESDFKRHLEGLFPDNTFIKNLITDTTIPDAFGKVETRLRLMFNSNIATSDTTMAFHAAVKIGMHKLDRTVTLPFNNGSVQFNPMMALIYYNRLVYRDSLASNGFTKFIPMEINRKAKREMENFFNFLGNARETFSVEDAVRNNDGTLNYDKLVYLQLKYNYDIPTYESLDDAQNSEALVFKVKGQEKEMIYGVGIPTENGASIDPNGSTILLTGMMKLPRFAVMAKGKDLHYEGDMVFVYSGRDKQNIITELKELWLKEC